MKHIFFTKQGFFESRVSSSRMLGQVARRRCLITRLHRLGPAPLAHFVADIERGAGIDATLERYAALPADFIRAYGGDKFAEPMFVIRGGQQ